MSSYSVAPIGALARQHRALVEAFKQQLHRDLGFALVGGLQILARNFRQSFHAAEAPGIFGLRHVGGDFE